MSPNNTAMIIPQPAKDSFWCSCSVQSLVPVAIQPINEIAATTPHVIPIRTGKVLFAKTRPSIANGTIAMTAKIDRDNNSIFAAIGKNRSPTISHRPATTRISPKAITGNGTNPIIQKVKWFVELSSYNCQRHIKLPIVMLITPDIILLFSTSLFSNA